MVDGLQWWVGGVGEVGQLVGWLVGCTCRASWMTQLAWGDGGSRWRYLHAYPSDA